MFGENSILRRIDLRALPISVKITLGLGIALAIGGVFTDIVMSQIVRESQSAEVLQDLQTFSRSQAFRVVDAINEQATILSRFGVSTVLQEGLLKHEAADIDKAAPSAGHIYEPDTVLTAELTTFRGEHPEFDSVALVSPEGHLIAISPVPPNVDKRADAKWPWFDAAFNNRIGATYISGPIEDNLTGQRGVHLAVPVYDQNSPGVTVGVLYAVWNLSNAQTLVTPGGERQGIVLEANGRVLLSPLQSQGTSVALKLLDLFKQSPSDAFIFTDDQQSRALYGYTRLDGLGLNDPAITKLGWIVVVREPGNVLEGNINFLLSRLRILLAIVAGAAAVAILALSRVLFLPLRRLTSAAGQIEHGSLDTPIPQFSKDEIGQLAAILDNVVSQLLRRVRQLRNAIQISRVTSVTRTTSQMLDDVARALGQQFDYPDVRIFLADMPNKRLRLEAAFGAESERLQKIGFRLPLDETSLVGRSMLLNEPLLGGGKEALRQAGLITEHSELSVPLSSGGQMLGAIHILAGRLRELDREDMEVMSLIADQLSASIQNARLIEQSHAQVAEIEALNRRLTRQAWEEYVGEAGALRHTLDPDQQWPSALGEVRQHTEIRAETYQDSDGRSVLAAPLILRGEPVGTLAVTRPGSEKWTRDEILLLESIASRMAMIAEGIRLVEESSRRADREQRVNEISATLLGRATSVETVLRSALNELGGALGSDRISLRIGAIPARDDRQIGAGDQGDAAGGSDAGSEGLTGPNGDGGSNDGAE